MSKSGRGRVKAGSAAEQRILDARPWVSPVHLCTPTFDGCVDDDASEIDTLDPDRVVSAAFLRQLLTTLEPASTDSTGLRLHGAAITGDLDLSWVTLEQPLECKDCRFTGRVTLDSAKLASVDLSGSQVPGLTARGTRIDGRLVLDRVTSTEVVDLDECRIDGSLLLRQATFGSAGRHDANTAALRFDLGRVEGECDATGITCNGIVRLNGATVGGQLTCRDGAFLSPRGTALSAKSASTGTVVLDGHFKAEGEVNLVAARIGGSLNCHGATIDNANGTALNADSLSTKGNVDLDGGFRAEGQVSLVAARIGGWLRCRDGAFIHGSGVALNANAVSTTGNVFLDSGFHARGEVNLAGAEIGRQLRCHGATLVNPGGRALDADSASTAGSVFLGRWSHEDGTADSFSAEGQVSLVAAKIGGSLNCHGATIDNANGAALDASSVSTTGNVDLGDGFRAKGEVTVAGAMIGRQLRCQGATLVNPGGMALNAYAASTKGSVLLDEWNHEDGSADRFSATGEVNLEAAKIGALRCTGGSFSAAGGTARAIRRNDRLHGGRAINLTNAVVAGSARFDGDFSAEGAVAVTGARLEQDLVVTGSFDAGVDTADALRLNRTDVATTLTLKPRSVAGIVDLTNASVATLRDSEATWPAKLRLEGFVYQYVDGEDGVAPKRRAKEWLTRHVDDDARKKFVPRPYEQLAATYRAAGLRPDASTVCVERARAERKNQPKSVNGWRHRIWSVVLDWTVGYGYRPFLALIWLVGLWLLAWYFVDLADAQDAMLLLVADDRRSPDLVPLVYALDLLVPVVDLGQRSYWQLEDSYAFVYWLSLLAGWVLITAIVTGVTSSSRQS